MSSADVDTFSTVGDWNEFGGHAYGILIDPVNSVRRTGSDPRSGAPSGTDGATCRKLGGFAALQDLARLPSTQVPEREDRRQMLSAWTCLALFPVVDRLGRRADQQTAVHG